MAITSYLDFAENDFKYFSHSYESGFVANAMAADAQEDLDLCAEAVKNCRTAIFEFIKRLEGSLSETNS